ncbi:MAG: sulfatase [Gemmatimonadota bacterium]|nr:sulfatase [Gemmatimonadota bacterium]
MATATATRVALCLALFTGLAEAALLGAAKIGLDRYVHRDPQVVWMAPLSNAVLFVVLLLPLALILRGRGERSAVRISATAFGFLSVWALLQLSTRLHPGAGIVLAVGVAWQAGRLAGDRAPLVSKVARRALIPLVALVVVAGLGLNARWALAERGALASLPAAPAGAPNVLLIILDTVRSASMSLYGYERPTTPRITQFAARGATFDRAVSPAPWTLPAHASLFTGRWAHELSTGWKSPLDGETPTLAEALTRGGYRTGGFVANYTYTSRESGLARGFARYEDYRVTPAHALRNSALGQMVFGRALLRGVLGHRDVIARKMAPVLARDVLRWHDEEPGRPWFAFLNFFDAHDPYLPPAPYDTMFARRGAPRNLTLANERPVTPEEARPERDVYDGAIAYLDAELGAMLDSLRARGVLDNTVVIITSDHGEEFGENGLLGHGNSLYYPALWVPLVIVYPRVVPAGVRVPNAVSTRDISATVLQLTGAASPRMPGRSLARFWGEGGGRAGGDPALDPATADTVLSMVQHATNLPAWFPVSDGTMHSLVAGMSHLIRDGKGRLSLYDVAEDPDARTDLAADSAGRARARRLDEALKALTAQ